MSKYNTLNIQRRSGGVIYLRRAVPTALQSIIGKREIVQSLGTCELPVARRRAMELGAEVEQRLADAWVTLAKAAPTGARIDACERSETGTSSAQVVNNAPRVPTLTAIRDAFLRERVLKLSSHKQYNAVVRRFCEQHGDLPVDAITRDQCRQLKEQLLARPNTGAGGANQNLTTLSALLSWAEVQGWREGNPVKGLKVRRSASERVRLPFTLDDLGMIFHPRHYPARRETVHFWLPALSLFTGARIEELAQLRLDDVRSDGGVHYLSITDEGPLQSLKNSSSRRTIPLHPQLLQLGFLTYADQTRESGADRLWPELPRWHYRWGTKPGRWFTRYLRHTAGIADPRKVFHSFRHTFKDACRAASLSEEVHDALTGHSRGTVSRGYGLGMGAQMKLLSEAVGRIKYPGLDLSPLSPMST
jgi:integrase